VSTQELVEGVTVAVAGGIEKLGVEVLVTGASDHCAQPAQQPALLIRAV
jgi:hypothetical protein